MSRILALLFLSSFSSPFVHILDTGVALLYSLSLAIFSAEWMIFTSINKASYNPSLRLQTGLPAAWYIMPPDGPLLLPKLNKIESKTFWCISFKHVKFGDLFFFFLCDYLHYQPEHSFKTRMVSYLIFALVSSALKMLIGWWRNWWASDNLKLL